MQRRALWIALALIFVWGTNFTVQKLIFPIVTPAGFLFVRFLLMPLCAALWMFYRYGVDWPPVDREDVRLLFKLALAGHVLHVGLVTFGIHLSTAFSSSLILWRNTDRCCSGRRGRPDAGAVLCVAPLHPSIDRPSSPSGVSSRLSAVARKRAYRVK